MLSLRNPPNLAILWAATASLALRVVGKWRFLSSSIRGPSANGRISFSTAQDGSEAVASMALRWAFSAWFGKGEEQQRKKQKHYTSASDSIS